MIKARVQSLNFTIENNNILKNVSFEIEKGGFVGIIGPNGSGKSTLLKNIYRAYKPSSGEIFINNKNIKDMKGRECSREIGVLRQDGEENFDFNVLEIVKMGRYPYKSLFEGYSKEDDKLVLDMLKKVGLEEFKDRSFLSLSGGEKQRALIARALVQNTDFLILDEPTNHLDIGYQIHLMDMVKSLKITTLSAIHDLNIAAMYCDYLIVMKNGEVYDMGKVEDIINEKMLKNVFGVNGYVFTNPINKRLQIGYMSSYENIEYK